MGLLVVVLGLIYAFIAFAPREVTQMALAGVWALMGLWVVCLSCYAFWHFLFA